MKRESVIEKDGEDRIEGDKIILHDYSPNEYRVLKTVEIITNNEIHIRTIKKTKNGGYLFN